MDPQATWDQLLRAYAEGDWESLEALAVALSNWLQKGGFPPVVIGHPGLGPDFEEALAKAACGHALSVLRTRWNVSVRDRKENT